MHKILLVDDDDILLSVLKAFLKIEGYEVVTAPDGIKALEIVGRDALDLMISDIRMRPMNGIELLRKVRALRSDLPVVMLTAYSSRETAHDAEALGAFAYLAKPFTNDEVVRIVRDAIASKPRQA